MSGVEIAFVVGALASAASGVAAAKGAARQAKDEKKANQVNVDAARIQGQLTATEKARATERMIRRNKVFAATSGLTLDVGSPVELEEFNASEGARSQFATLFNSEVAATQFLTTANLLGKKAKSIQKQGTTSAVVKLASASTAKGSPFAKGGSMEFGKKA